MFRTCAHTRLPQTPLGSDSLPLRGALDRGEDREAVLGVCGNGAVLELSDRGFKRVEQFEEPRVLVEGRQGGDVSKLVLKDRRVLGERGVVFALLVRNEESRRIIAGPELVSKGFANETLAPHLMDEARKLVKKLINEYDRELREGQPEPDFQETVRVELRRFFERNLGHKPTVMPMILDI
jgi:ribonuclease J